jgi:predicted nucleic-acid-binding Zn-ribbon protein
MNDIRRLEPPCAKCGSTRIIPRARLTELAPHVHEVSVRVAVTERPEALVFKGEKHVDTYAKVCGACGYVEVYVDDPSALYDSYTRSREPR